MGCIKDTNYWDRFNPNRYSEPRRFLVRYFDTKKLYNKTSTFYNRNAAIIFINGLKFIGSELEVYDTKDKKIIKYSKRDGLKND